MITKQQVSRRGFLKYGATALGASLLRSPLQATSFPNTETSDQVRFRLENLDFSVRNLGKPAWRPMLAYVAGLHGRSIHPAQAPFPYPWEEIGPGYCFGRAFGHWDLIHAVLDSLEAEPEHAEHQLANYFALQYDDGMLPGSIFQRHGIFSLDKSKKGNQTHPPVWPAAVEALYEKTGRLDLLELWWKNLVAQLGWFETKRRVGDGFFYSDMLGHSYESGIDAGVRFMTVHSEPTPCVDATSHVFGLYDAAVSWGARLGKNTAPFSVKRDALGKYIRQSLFDADTGYFQDSWSVGHPEQRPVAFEGMWPMVVGAASPQQAHRVIDENFLNPHRFYSIHPITSVGVEDPRFSLRMWRGPAWNSMTMWAARGCLRYQRPDAAQKLLERALEASAQQFARTGTIWEFYHPQGGSEMELQRKPNYNMPCRDYLGHNPLIAMALLWEKSTAKQSL